MSGRTGPSVLKKRMGRLWHLPRIVAHTVSVPQTGRGKQPLEPEIDRRSASKKYAASLSRGRMTRSLPLRTVSTSRLAMLLTAMKCGISAPSSPATGK